MKKFTLTELLIVVSIIGILAGILLPIISGSRQRTMEMKAKADIANIMNAINKYESTYGKLPVPLDENGEPLPLFFLAGNDVFEKGNEFGKISDGGYDILMQSLSNIDIEEDTLNGDDVIIGNDGEKVRWYTLSDVDITTTFYKIMRAMNPRRTAFLDVPNEFPYTGLLDPWGNRYIVVVDYEDDGNGEPPNGEYGDDSDNPEYAPYDKLIEQPAFAMLPLLDDNGDTVFNNATTLREALGVVNQPATDRGHVLVYSMGPNGRDEGGLGPEIHEDFDDVKSWGSF